MLAGGLPPRLARLGGHGGRRTHTDFQHSQCLLPRRLLNGLVDRNASSWDASPKRSEFFSSRRKGKFK